MNKEQLKNEDYVFINSTKIELIEKAKKIFPTGEVVANDRKRCCFISCNKKPVYFSALNDIKDFQLENINKKPEPHHETLVSFADITENGFVAATDFWGIQSHYFYYTSDTFIVSSNVFLIRSIVEEQVEFDREALYEYLFFGAPLNEKTWFCGIRCLLPGQRLEYLIKTGKLQLSNPTDFYHEFMKPALPLLDAAEKYFKNVKKAVNEEPVYLALSAGSDSRSILAALRHFGFNLHCVSWGKENYLEKDQVKKLANIINVPLEFFPLVDFETKYEDFLLAGTKKTNGLMNPFRTHYVEYYSKLSGSGNYFEGILGSEFVKGEISCPTMTSLLMKEVISDRETVSQVIDKYYKELCADFKSQFKRYIQDKYSSLLIDINAKTGRDTYANYAFQFIPAKIFSGLILLVKDKMNAYFPYLDPSLLNGIFQGGFGIKNYTSMATNFPSTLKSILPESLLVQKYDKKLFSLKLDRGISFRDSLRNPLFLKCIQLLTKIRNRLSSNSSKFGGQIDNSLIKKIILINMKNIQSPILPVDNSLDNINIAKAIIMYDCLSKC